MLMYVRSLAKIVPPTQNLMKKALLEIKVNQSYLNLISPIV